MKFLGSKGNSQLTVSPDHFAINVGSGDLEVFSTPSLITLMEKTAMQSIQHLLLPEQSSVGIFIETQHLKASKIGTELHCTSEVIEATDKIVTFQVRNHRQSRWLERREPLKAVNLTAALSRGLFFENI